MSKARATDLVKQLRDAAYLQDPVAKAAIELIQLMADAAKESLVSAVEDDMLRIQGAARAWSKLHTDLTTQPPSIHRTENP